MRNVLLYIGISSLLLYSCSDSEIYLEETNVDSFYPESMVGFSAEQQEEILKVRDSIIAINTIGKYIPKTSVQGLDGADYNLQDLLVKESILLFGGSECIHCTDFFIQNFIGAVVNNKESNSFDLICIIEKTELDKKDPIKLNLLLSLLNVFYPEVYTIETEEAKKLNFYAYPTRHYINKDKRIFFSRWGNNSPEKLSKEIKRNSAYI